MKTLIRILLVPAIAMCATYGTAEVVLDGSIGRSGALTGPNYSITGDLGKQLGGNLFHSFSSFNLIKNESAIFSGPNSVQNIISRVTGGSKSFIDGTMRSTIPKVDLYFINPSGIVFGQNAKIDLNGSFHASTADYIKFADGGRFYATSPADSLLTIAPPSAFGFLTDSPRGISVEGSLLKVAESKTLSMIAGDVAIKNGTLQAPSGTINLISVASKGEAITNGDGFQTASFTRMGNISIEDIRQASERPSYDFMTITPAGNVDVSGKNSGGQVYIRAHGFVIDNGQLNADTYGSGNALGIDIELRGDLTASNESVISSATRGSGHGGDISIDVQKLTLLSGSAFDTPTKGAGIGGSLAINASDSVSMSGSKGTSVSGIYNNAFGEGGGGSVSIASPLVTMEDGARIETAAVSSGNAGKTYLNARKLSMTGGACINTASFGSGDAGVLNITAAESISLSGKNTGIYCSVFGSGAGSTSSITTPVLNMSNFARIEQATAGTGNAGAMFVNVGKLFMTDWGEITASSFDAGKGGDLHITASEAMSLSNWGSISNGARAQGDGGDTFIKTPSLSLNDDGKISSNSFGAGKGGNIFIDAGVLTINRGDIDASSYSGGGDGGNISITASESVNLSNFGRIRDELFSGSNGNGGKISISAPSLTLDNYSSVTAAVHSDNSSKTGSDIRIKASKITIHNSSYITTSTWAAGNGGSIFIDAGESVLLADSHIDTEVHESGRGGSITVNTANLKMEGSTICTTSNILASGAAGNISLNVGELSANNSSIQSETQGSGKGGDTFIKAAGAVTVSDNSRVESSAGSGGGDGGNISVTAGSLSVTNDSVILSSGQKAGKGGDIRIEASGTLLISHSRIDSSAAYGSETYPGSGDGGDISIKASSLISDEGAIRSGTRWTGNAGNISLEVGKLELKNNSEIDAVTSGAGKGGNLAINAKESFAISDSEISGWVYGSGNGGAISIQSPDVRIDNAEISVWKAGSGDGVSMRFDVGRLALVNGAVIDVDDSNGIGKSPSLSISASESVTISSGGITGESYGNGEGVAISIITPSLSMNNAGVITTSNWGAGKGGNIFIKASDSVSLSGYELVEGSFYRTAIASETGGTGNAGNINIETGKLTLSALGYISTSAREGSEGAAGNITVKAADSVSLSGFYDAGYGVYGAEIVSETFSKGNAGSINIETGKLTLSALGYISTSAREGSEGAGGNITIRASDYASISGYYDKSGVGMYGSTIASRTWGKGDSGGISIESNYLSLFDRGRLTTAAQSGSEGTAGAISVSANRIDVKGAASVSSASAGVGNAGSIDINAFQSINLQDSGFRTSSEQSNGGNIRISAPDISLNDNALISASVSGGKGKGGSVRISAGNLVVLGGSRLETSTGGAGQGGNVTADITDKLELSGSGTNGSSGMFSTSSSSGAAGLITVTTPLFSLSESAQINVSASGTGMGGDIGIDAKELNLSGKSSILSESTSTGAAGSVAVKAQDAVILADSSITTATQNADGGNISIDPRMVRLTNSEITATARGGTGNGGNISMSADNIVLDKSNIIANAEGGNGGNITVKASVFLQTPDSMVSASSRFGLQGNVTINAPIVNVTGNLADLPKTFLNAESMLPKLCAESEEDASSFVVKGRDGLPKSPGGLLASP